MEREAARRPDRKASGMFGLSQRQARNVLRFCHLTTGMLLVPFVYSPLGDVAAFEWVVRVALVPLTIITGLSMWHQARLRRFLSGGRHG